jgi:hypothetical protein
MTRRHFGGPSAQPLGRRLAFRPRVLPLEDRSLPDTTPVEPPADPAAPTPPDPAVVTDTPDPAATTTTPDPAAPTAPDPAAPTTPDPAVTIDTPEPEPTTTTTPDPPAPQPTAPAPYLAVGAEAGNGPLVKVYDTATGQVKHQFLAYDAAFRGGVRVATGDVTGDGVDDVITAPGYGGGPLVKVFDGQTGTELRRFMAYHHTFRGGVYVAAGDVNGDGHADIITGAGEFGGPHVRVFNGAWAVPPLVIQNPAPQTPVPDPAPSPPPPAEDVTDGMTDGPVDGATDGDPTTDDMTPAPVAPAPAVVPSPVDTTTQVLDEFMAYAMAFRGGVRVAAADVTGDGKADVITAAGSGGGPHVKVYDGVTHQLGREWMAYGLAFTGGVYVSAGDLDGDGKAEVVTGTGVRGGTQVRIFKGDTGAMARGFTAAALSTTASVRVAVVDYDRDGRDDLLTSVGSSVQVRDGMTTAVKNAFTPLEPGFRNGLAMG